MITQAKVFLKDPKKKETTVKQEYCKPQKKYAIIVFIVLIVLTIAGLYFIIQHIDKETELKTPAKTPKIPLDVLKDILSENDFKRIEGSDPTLNDLVEKRLVFRNLRKHPQISEEIKNCIKLKVEDLFPGKFEEIEDMVIDITNPKVRTVLELLAKLQIKPEEQMKEITKHLGNTNLLKPEVKDATGKNEYQNKEESLQQEMKNTLISPQQEKNRRKDKSGRKKIQENEIEFEAIQNSEEEVRERNIRLKKERLWKKRNQLQAIESSDEEINPEKETRRKRRVGIREGEVVDGNKHPVQSGRRRARKAKTLQSAASHVPKEREQKGIIGRTMDFIVGGWRNVTGSGETADSLAEKLPEEIPDLDSPELMDSENFDLQNPIPDPNDDLTEKIVRVPGMKSAGDGSDSDSDDADEEFFSADSGEDFHSVEFDKFIGNYVKDQNRYFSQDGDSSAESEGKVVNVDEIPRNELMRRQIIQKPAGENEDTLSGPDFLAVWPREISRQGDVIPPLNLTTTPPTFTLPIQSIQQTSLGPNIKIQTLSNPVISQPAVPQPELLPKSTVQRLSLPVQQQVTVEKETSSTPVSLPLHEALPGQRQDATRIIQVSLKTALAQSLESPPKEISASQKLQGFKPVQSSGQKPDPKAPILKLESEHGSQRHLSTWGGLDENVYPEAATLTPQIQRRSESPINQEVRERPDSRNSSSIIQDFRPIRGKSEITGPQDALKSPQRVLTPKDGEIAGPLGVALPVVQPVFHPQQPLESNAESLAPLNIQIEADESVVPSEGEECNSAEEYFNGDETRGFQSGDEQKEKINMPSLESLTVEGGNIGDAELENTTEPGFLGKTANSVIEATKNVFDWFSWDSVKNDDEGTDASLIPISEGSSSQPEQQNLEDLSTED